MLGAEDKQAPWLWCTLAACSPPSPAPPRVPRLQGHGQWTHAHAQWRTVAALLRLSGSAALAQLWPAALPALAAAAADHDRDPRLRLELLHLVAALLEDDSKADGWRQAGAGQALVASVLSPALAWRAGRVSAALRYAALAALASLLSRRRLPPEQLAAAVCSSGARSDAAAAAAASSSSSGGGGSGLVERVAGCLDEEYEPDTRQLACHVTGLLLEAGGWAGSKVGRPDEPAGLHAPSACKRPMHRGWQKCSASFPSEKAPALPALAGLAVGTQLSPPQLAALHPELLKRLDDSSNRVRVAACTALQHWLRATAAAAPQQGGLPDSEASALASSLLIHVGDPAGEVAGAVCRLMEQLAALSPGTIRPLAAAAAGAHARGDLLQRVLAACGAA